jgi:hypothetical protein
MIWHAATHIFVQNTLPANRILAPNKALTGTHPMYQLVVIPVPSLAVL